LHTRFSSANIIPMDKELKLYEASYLISPAKSDEEARNFHETLKNRLPDLGGLIEENGAVIKRKLYYPIKKMKEAYLAHFKFMLEPEKLAELKKKLEEKDVLRYLLVETKRIPQRIFRPRVFKAPAMETVPAGKAAEKIEMKPLEPAADIEAIDKQLEEILGK